MTKRKYKLFIDVVTVLLVFFPLIMSIVTARANGNFDVAAYVNDFAISQDLTARVSAAVSSFGIAFDGAYAVAALVLFSNAILIYLFRVMLAVALWLPKLAYNLINLNFEGDT